MEIVIGIIVVIVVLKILGVSNITIIFGILGLVELLIAAMLIFFIAAFIFLLFSKKKRGVFSHFAVPEKGKFKVAYYLVDNKVIPCVFPREAGLSGVMYKADKVVKLRYSKKLNKVFDIWSVITCITGIVFTVYAIIFTLKIIDVSGMFM